MKWICDINIVDLIEEHSLAGDSLSLFLLKFYSLWSLHLNGYGPMDIFTTSSPVVQFSMWCNHVTSLLCLPLCPGVWAASFMKWSRADLSSLDRLWRMSFTSYSASLVRETPGGMWMSICFSCVCTVYELLNAHVHYIIFVLFNRYSYGRDLARYHHQWRV